MKVPQFWLLMATFFVCGYTSNGMVLTHFMPHALEHNFSELQASTALGVMGAMNVLGTITSGWICDRFGRRGPLAFYYFFRGLSLDRKSTRLNSSHSQISYAVFCLKKKKNP